MVRGDISNEDAWPVLLQIGVHVDDGKGITWLTGNTQNSYAKGKQPEKMYN